MVRYTSRHATDHHQAVLNLNGRDINGNQTPFNPLPGRLPTEHGRVLACTCAHVHLQHSTNSTATVHYSAIKYLTYSGRTVPEGDWLTCLAATCDQPSHPTHPESPPEPSVH
nr:hypothetical protein [Trichoderma harzianum]